MPSLRSSPATRPTGCSGTTKGPWPQPRRATGWTAADAAARRVAAAHYWTEHDHAALHVRPACSAVSPQVFQLVSRWPLVCVIAAQLRVRPCREGACRAATAAPARLRRPWTSPRHPQRPPPTADAPVRQWVIASHQVVTCRTGFQHDIANPACSGLECRRRYDGSPNRFAHSPWRRRGSCNNQLHISIRPPALSCCVNEPHTSRGPASASFASARSATEAASSVPSASALRVLNRTQ